MIVEDICRERCVESRFYSESRVQAVKLNGIPNRRGRRRPPIIPHNVLGATVLVVVHSMTVMTFLSTAKIFATKMKTAFITTANQRRASSSGQKSLQIMSSLKSSDKSFRRRRSFAMITDSRELRYMDGCSDGDIVSTFGKSVLWTNVPEYREKPSTLLSQMESLEKSYRLPEPGIASKGTMSFVEEMIASSYFKVLEDNQGIVSNVLGPLLDTIHANANHQSRTNHGQTQQKNQQLQQPTFRQMDTATTLPAAATPSVGFFGSAERGRGIDPLTTSTCKGSRDYSTITTRQEKFSSTGMQQSRTVGNHEKNERPPRSGYGASIQLTEQERELFQLLRRVRKETNLSTTLRVAGGWVRDKLLATPEFQSYHKIFSVGKACLESNRLTSKFRTSAPSMGRQGTKVLVASPRSNHGDDFQPVDIDIALDDMLGREFADHLNEYLALKGEKTVSIGMVLKNPEKSKHLETATMKVNSFWIDFVNLRAEEYTKDSRIPDLMRIGSAKEDSYRRDLTINSLFYNINTGEIEDWTGRGFDDLRKGIIATPLRPLTTLLDDPLRVLRSIRFAARLRFTMDSELVAAAKDTKVATALQSKVSRERVGGELDLMIRSPDPVSAVRLLINLNLMDSVFPIIKYFSNTIGLHPVHGLKSDPIFQRGLELLSVTHDHLADCRWSPPVWCSKQDEDNLESPAAISYDAAETRLLEDEESQRLLWYAAFITPVYHEFEAYQKRVASKTVKHHNESTSSNPPSNPGQGKKTNRSIISRIFVDELKRPTRDAEAIEKIIKASDEFIQLVHEGCYASAEMMLLSDIRVTYSSDTESFQCYMHGRKVDSCLEDDPLWEHAMDFRLLCSNVMHKVGPLWRAALCLSIARELVEVLHEDSNSIQYVIEGDVIDESQEEFRHGIIERFDVFATALQQIGLIGIWNVKPLVPGDVIRTECLQGIPQGPAFREVMDEQLTWMTTHPGRNIKALFEHLKEKFFYYQ